MELRVRRATLNDVRGIVEVHCSDVREWRRLVEETGARASYEELSVEDKFLHGGPWMSVETCAIHLNYLLTAGQHPLVAELDGRVVGELELYIGEERGALGRTGYIDVLVVHRDYRGRGIGRRLVEEAKRIAAHEGCDAISVWPERRAVPFYEKCGLRRVAYRVLHVVVSVACCEAPNTSLREFPQSYEELADMWFLAPRIYSSFTAWLKSRWSYALRVAWTKLYEAYVPSLDAALVLEGVPLKSGEARLSLWIGDVSRAREALLYACGKAAGLGVRRLHLLAEEAVCRQLVKGLAAEAVGEEVVLMEELRQ
ncbi:MAG: GNAT family N-acetyltransferase [Thermoprotei archaeon]|nr:MAG: GNAT family N-acetyltransferase [Thermoprotei archaeon]